MPQVQIEEAELANLRGNSTALGQMLANKDARSLLLKAQKIVKPDAVIPEIDARAPVDEALETIRKEMADDRAARAKEKTDEDERRRLDAFKNSWDAQKRVIRDRYPALNDAGIDEIEKLAKERGIPDLEAAGALFMQLHPPAPVGDPNAGGMGGWNFFDAPQDNMKEHMAKLMESKGDNEPELNSMIREAIADVRGQRRAA